ncbi:hypothetical protein F4814DRAFT_435405 [Daldinia grandis]|nr:hypothetical protein F4814DRAFT_435405 [Daldinia grandis]
MDVLSITWWPGCGPSDIRARGATMGAVQAQCQHAEFNKFTQLYIRAGIHTSDSDALDHVTVWCKSWDQLRDSTHQTAHIYVTPRNYIHTGHIVWDTVHSDYTTDDD